MPLQTPTAAYIPLLQRERYTLWVSSRQTTLDEFSSLLASVFSNVSEYMPSPPPNIIFLMLATKCFLGMHPLSFRNTYSDTKPRQLLKKTTTMLRGANTLIDLKD